MVNRYAVGMKPLSSAPKFLFLLLEDIRHVSNATMKNDNWHYYVCPSAHVRATSKWQIILKFFT